VRKKDLKLSLAIFLISAVVLSSPKAAVMFPVAIRRRFGDRSKKSAPSTLLITLMQLIGVILTAEIRVYTALNSISFRSLLFPGFFFFNFMYL
jgi:hypothetical protein